MKELTVEQKAKAYDEAKLRMSTAYNSNKCTIDFMNEIFPELKESEDEKIRKEIIDVIRHSANSMPAEKFNERIAWLEKQGENTENKIEPKFKVGDWVISPYGNIACIKSIDKANYNLLLINGDSAKILIEYIDNWHKWTIQDVKDGDVLSYRNGQWIFIYKEKIDDNCFYYHALYSTIQGLTITNAGFTLLNDYVPATKEQRDLLFQKMKEADYEWNAKKKELKKLTKEIPDEKHNLTKEDEKIIRGLIGLCDGWTCHSFYPIENCDTETLKNWLKSLKDRIQHQNTWKPSMAQLNALSIVSKGNAPDDIEAIVSLYNDLKKLK